MLSQAQDIKRGDVGMEKRKPVRRDPERRRQQNIEAQKRYRQKLRRRLNHLEELAAPAGSTGPSEAITTQGSSNIPTHIIAQSLPAYDAWDVFVPSSSTETLGEYQHSTPQLDDTTPSELSIWDFTPHTDPSLFIFDKLNDGVRPYWTTTVNCGCSSTHVQIEKQGPGPYNYGQVRIHSSSPSAAAADPYTNNLRIETVCVASALCNLAMYIGIAREMLCVDECPSPFFQSSAESADGMVRANMICAVQESFKTLKPDLRPSNEQITVKHHAYIDILPFPTLRRNIIAHQEEIDEDEFLHDMLTGLVCWGGAGIGGKDRAESTGYASTGTPWDVRSWEARMWFLMKYWALLGGGDGELVRQSQWWSSIRGEDDLLNMARYN